MYEFDIVLLFISLLRGLDRVEDLDQHHVEAWGEALGLLVQDLDVEADDADQVRQSVGVVVLDQHVEARVGDGGVQLPAYFIIDIEQLGLWSFKKIQKDVESRPHLSENFLGTLFNSLFLSQTACLVKGFQLLYDHHCELTAIVHHKIRRCVHIVLALLLLQLLVQILYDGL